jgi:uncharacterized membrane protein YtjA (UPF0391 family)
MLWWVLVLLVITAALAVLGFTAHLFVLKVLFWVFLALLVISFIASLLTGGRRGVAT